ncbi:ABC transporter permease [Thalassospira sp.]|uniref:ABC transporter permease n=1 Tax=Thalassospira sp. TaxID=1912094 RepID=UPI003AA7E845
MEWIVPFILTVITASTPLLLAASGELITEKSGVLNLGVEGMMLVGAIAGFAASASTGSAIIGILAAVAAGVLMSLIFAFLTLTLMANQVATGLALTIFGVGFSALVGSGFVGFAMDPLPALSIPGISAIPIIGPILFGQDFLVYLSIAVVIGISWFLSKSRAGLVLKAVGDSHHSAHAIGYSVIKIRYLATMFGGAMAGLGGAYLSLSYTPMWAENMTAGRGWIALALVVFATWRPGRLVAGAYMFGLISVMQLHAQGAGIHVPSQFMSMLPYLATVIVLVIISSDRAKIRLNAPACIGQAFRAAQ